MPTAHTSNTRGPRYTGTYTTMYDRTKKRTFCLRLRFVTLLLLQLLSRLHAGGVSARHPRGRATLWEVVCFVCAKMVTMCVKAYRLLVHRSFRLGLHGAVGRAVLLGGKHVLRKVRVTQGLPTPVRVSRCAPVQIPKAQKKT